MREIIFATKNVGKLQEFNHAFSETDIKFVSLAHITNAPDVEETGETYADNALLKARAIATHTGEPTVADDSGIEIDAMPEELGVRSARFAGGRPYTVVNDEILKRLKNAKDRSCRYQCAIAYVDPSTNYEKVVHGSCEGVISAEPKGDGGFGYDPIFYLPLHDKTMAQVPLDVKNKISHRAKAIEALRAILSK